MASSQTTWGKLSLDVSQPMPDLSSYPSMKLIPCICICGRKTAVPFCRLNTGNTKSCGKCRFKPKEYWLSQIWGSLKLDPEQELPEGWSPKSSKIFRFLCICGKTTNTAFSDVSTGKSTKCRKCGWMPKEYWLQQKWGSLRLNNLQQLPSVIAPSVGYKLSFICDCGNETAVRLCDVTNGHISSCGTCDWQDSYFWKQQRWGKLKIDPNQPLPDKFGSGFGWIITNCDCGNNLTTKFSNLMFGYTQSCGCIVPGKSELSPAHEIYDFIKPMAPDAEFSYWWKTEGNKRREYDIYTPSKKLAIEYHGIVWHSERYATNSKKDHEKLLLAKTRGDRLIQIYSDEWRDKQEIIKSQLREILAPEKKTRIKPTFESVRGKTQKEVKDFLDKHHYLGSAGGCLTVVAKHKDEIVGVWVFKKRETGVILWHRACWNHAYKAWNPHGKALNLALSLLKEMGFKRIVTFSDNRFHTGGLYEKLGFTLEKELKPDYGYTNGTQRLSKAALRVRAGQRESQLAKIKGWYRIWDSGKKRWGLTLSIPIDR